MMISSFSKRGIMVRAIDEHTITDAVIDQMSGTKNERLKEIMEAAVQHLHDFARQVNLTPDEWIEGIRFLTATGHAWRPAHNHFLVAAPGYREAITALYMADDEHIDSGTVFGAVRDAALGRVGADPSQLVTKA